MTILFFRYGPDFLLLALLILIFFRSARTKQQKRKRAILFLKRIAPLTLASYLLCAWAIPFVFGSFFVTARYLPQKLEAHKLRLYWQVACLIPGVKASDEDIQETIEEIGAEYSMHPALIRALVQVESSSNQMAISPLGACGLTQMMPNTYYSMARGNPFSVRSNLRAGTLYLRKLYRRYNGNLDLALAAYNAGPGTIARHGRVPPGSVSRYVAKVRRLYKQYKKG